MLIYLNLSEKLVTDRVWNLAVFPRKYEKETEEMGR